VHGEWHAGDGRRDGGARLAAITNLRYFQGVGRIAGVSPAETRQRLLDTAAEVFGRCGYEGANIAEIASQAGLSTGAIYAHYAGKAELFEATLRAHADAEFESLLGPESTLDFATYLEQRGSALDQPRPANESLLIEGIVASRRHPEVATLLRDSVASRQGRLAELLRAAQEVGAVDDTLSAEAVVRFAFMAAVGSLLVGALDLPPVDHDAWTALIRRLVDNIRTQEGSD